MFTLVKKYPLLFILLFAVVLRLPLINGSFWLDEAAQALESNRPFAQQFRIADDFQPPLLHYITHFLLQFSKSEWWLRLSSLVAGVASIAFTYLLVSKLFSKKAAILTGILLALSPFHIFYSQELRPYMLATLFATISWWAFVSSIRNSKRRRLFHGLFIMSTILGLYSMYLYPFIVLSQLIFVFIEERKSFTRLLLALGIVSIFCLPWLPFFIEQLRVGVGLQALLPGWSSAVATPQLKVLPLTLAKFLIGQVKLEGSVYRMGLTMIPVGALLFSMVVSWKSSKNRLLFYWFFIPLIASWLVSFIIPVIQPKRLLVILPAAFALMGTGMVTLMYSSAKEKLLPLLNASTRRFVGMVIVAVVLVTLSLSTLLYYGQPIYQREDWRSVIAVVEKSVVASDSVALFIFPESYAPWRWYADPSIQTLTTKTLTVKTSQQLEEAFFEALKYETVITFDYLTDLTDPQRLLLSWLLSQGYKEVSILDGKDIGFVRIYSRVANLALNL